MTSAIPRPRARFSLVIRRPRNVAALLAGIGVLPSGIVPPSRLTVGRGTWVKAYTSETASGLVQCKQGGLALTTRLYRDEVEQTLA